MKNRTTVEIRRDNMMLQAAFQEFSKVYRESVTIVDIISLVLVILGVLGSLISLWTLLKNQSMALPSFSYHKALVASDLVFCLNWLLLKLVQKTFVLKSYIFTNYLAAFYAAILCRAISSTCGYVALYMTLCISLDRFLALTIPMKYRCFNQPAVCNSLILISLIVSSTFHSWSTYVETRVVENVDRRDNGTFFTTETTRKNSLESLIRAKDIYNACIRVPYPFVLMVLTIISILLFAKQNRRRMTMLISSVARHNQQRQRRRERSLFLLMISVVVLTFIQVIPRESKRILEIAYPEAEMMNVTLDVNMPISYRLSCFHMVLYGDKFFILIANLCTAINRALLFYLYFFLNQSFRAAVLVTLKRVVRKPQSLSVRLSDRLTSKNFRSRSNAGSSNILPATPPTPTVSINDLLGAKGKGKVSGLCSDKHLQFDINSVRSDSCLMKGTRNGEQQDTLNRENLIQLGQKSRSFTSKL